MDNVGETASKAAGEAVAAVVAAQIKEQTRQVLGLSAQISWPSPVNIQPCFFENILMIMQIRMLGLQQRQPLLPSVLTASSTRSWHKLRQSSAPVVFDLCSYYFVFNEGLLSSADLFELWTKNKHTGNIIF
jgi:hypothetical protein